MVRSPVYRSGTSQMTSADLEYKYSYTESLDKKILYI